MLASTPPPTSSYTAKRTALNISSGPRPLQLVDGNGAQVSTTTTNLNSPLSTPILDSPHSYSPSLASPTTPRTPNTSNNARYAPRRQSSISYNPRDSNPLSPTHASSLLRSTSLGPRPFHDRRSTGSILHLNESSTTGEEKERPPLTLVEKHADLLHFIAQKESKCLELRSQLALHEAELLQLKRKWERIVSRGLEKERSSSPHSTAFTADSTYTPTSPNSGAMLEGIREGVQGVSRLLAYSLSSSSPSPLSSDSRPSSPLTQTNAKLRMKEKTHAQTQSTSSVSTYATTGTTLSGSTRLSQSSSSSLDPLDHDDEFGDFEEGAPATKGVDGKGKEKEIQILMVRDTGATPLPSPNPEFIQQSFEQSQMAQQAQLRKEKERVSLPTQGSMRARRKSREIPLDTTAFGEVGLMDDTYEKDKKSREGKESDTERKKRNRMSLQHTSSGGGPGVSSWVGSMVGKKWEDTISKNHKRASILLSDVSQSIAQALAAPPLSSSSSSSSASPSLFSPPAPISRSHSHSYAPSNSILDDHNDMDDSSGLGLLSIPSLEPQLLSSSRSPSPSPSRSATPSAPTGRVQTNGNGVEAKTKPMGLSPKNTKPQMNSKASLNASEKGKKEDEDEWNW